MPIPALIKRQSSASLASFDKKQLPCVTGSICSIPVDHISPNRFQPRKSFDSSSLLRLADSIKRYGVLQPITVRALSSSDKPKLFEIICGERRYRAAIIAGLDHIPCNVINSSDVDSAELSIIENLLRDDLNMFEQAESFNLLIVTFNLTQEEVALRVSLSQSAVANKLRLLRFSSEEKKLILDSGLTERHARTLLRLPDAASRMRFINQINKDKLNVAATEALVDNYLRYLAENPASNDNISNNARLFGGHSTGIVKDIRILTNTIENAAAMLRKSGISVETKSEDTPDAFNINISVHKAKLANERRFT